MKRVGVVVHAVHADDHRPGLFSVLSVPPRQTQPRAVEANQCVVLEARTAEACLWPRRLLEARGACRQQDGDNDGRDKPAGEAFHGASMFATRRRK